jgi:diguanylate cyclase (GGDEF)-like protein/PAS domain S-box-containing protein
MQTLTAGPMTEADLAALQDDPVAHWVQDLERHRVVWANAAALPLLAAESLDELRARDVTPLLPATRLRVADYLIRLARGERIATMWTTFLPSMQPVPLRQVIHPFRLADGRIAALFEAHDVRAHTCNEALRMLEALRHSTAMVGIFSAAGTLLERNVAMLQALGDLSALAGDHFAQCFADRAVAERVRAAVLTTGSFSGRAEMRTLIGDRHHQVQAVVILDPADGARVIHLESMDVTREVLAEERARDSEHLLEQMADELPQPVGYLTPEFNYRFVNKALADWVGVPRADLIGRSVASVVGAPMQALLGRYWPKVEAGERANYERRFEVRGREPRWISVDLVPHRVAGRTAGAFVFAYDVHALKLAESEREVSEQKLIQVSDSLPVAVLQVDREMRVRFVNQAFCTWFEVRRENVLGRQLAEVLGSNALDAMRAALDHALAGRSANYRHEARMGAVTRWLDFTLAPFRGKGDASIEGALIVMADVDDRVRAHRELRRSQEELASHLANTPLAVVQMDAFRRVTHWSGRAEPLFGWTREQVSGRPLDEIGLFDAEHAARFDHELRFLDAQSGDRFVFAARNLRRDGQAVFGEWYCSVVRDERGRATSYLALVEDVSQRVNAEKHLSYLTTHDVLTGLGNRNRFGEVLQSMIDRSAHTGGGLTLVVGDIDRFKYVNDSLGHHAGDALLREVARRGKALFPEALAAARLGADEFAWLLSCPARDLVATREMIISAHAALNRPYELGGQPAYLALSFGVAHFPADAATDADLMSRGRLGALPGQGWQACRGAFLRRRGRSGWPGAPFARGRVATGHRARATGTALSAQAATADWPRHERRSPDPVAAPRARTHSARCLHPAR